MSAIPAVPTTDFVRRKTLMAMYIWKRDKPVTPDKYKSHDKIIGKPRFIGMFLLYHELYEKGITERIFVQLF